MRPLVVSLLIVFAATNAAAQASKPVQSCPLLDLSDAAALTGPGVEFLSGREGAGQGGAKTYLCFFAVGEGRSLTVKSAPLIVKNAAEYQKMMDPLLKATGGSVETGLGEYAYSKLDSASAELTVVKGAASMSLELKGKGLAATDLEKMRTIAKKMLGKL